MREYARRRLSEPFRAPTFQNSGSSTGHHRGSLRLAAPGGVVVCLAGLAMGGAFLPGDAHAACAVPPKTKADFHCIDEGFGVFTEETFEGNGRTCATCHRPETNYTVAPQDIRRLSSEERALVFANNVPGLENRTLVRELASFNTSGGRDARDPSTFDGDGDPATSDVLGSEGPIFRSAITLGGIELTTLMNPDVVVGFEGSPSVPRFCNNGVLFELDQLGWGATDRRARRAGTRTGMISFAVGRTTTTRTSMPTGRSVPSPTAPSRNTPRRA